MIDTLIARLSAPAKAEIMTMAMHARRSTGQSFRWAFARLAARGINQESNK